jgi:hypothetical protein
LSDLVKTYSGHRLHEAPRRFMLQGSWHTVVQILARWQEPDTLCFIVIAEDIPLSIRKRKTSGKWTFTTQKSQSPNHFQKIPFLFFNI